MIVTGWMSDYFSDRQYQFDAGEFIVMQEECAQLGEKFE